MIVPGEIRAGDAVRILHRPEHGVTVALQFRAVTTERSLLARLPEAGPALHPDAMAKARRHMETHGNEQTA